MVKVKICGNHVEEDIRALEPYREQVDRVGFIFTTKSKRYVTPQAVCEWLSTYEYLLPKAVGVFMDQPLEEVISICRLTGLQRVQLHGEESPAYCQQLREKYDQELDICKVIPVSAEGYSSFSPYLPYINSILLDTQVKGVSGGTGQEFNWTIIPTILDQLKEEDCPLWIAGGLKAERMKDLLSVYPIHGIDVASGVETSLRKDSDKIKELVEEVAKYEYEA